MVGLIENHRSEGYQLSIRVGTEISQKAVIGNPLSIFQIIMVTGNYGGIIPKAVIASVDNFWRLSIPTLPV